MASSIRSSRESRGRKLKLSQRGDPQARPFLTRIYGLIGCLIVSLALIVLLIILQKKLPDGSKSAFHIPVRRNLEVPAVEQELAERKEEVLNVEKRSAELEPRITLAPTFIPEPILHLGCYSTQVNCVTIDQPDRLRPRYQQVECSSSYIQTPCTTSTSSTPIFIPIISPIRFSWFPITPTPTPTCISGMNVEVSCTTQPIIIPRQIKRQEETICSTTTLGPCSTSTRSTPIRTPTPTCISGVSLAVECTTLFRAAKRQELVCATSTLGSCSTSTSSSSTSSTTSTPPSVTTPPVSVSSNSCVATSASCSTWGNVDAGFQSSCTTLYSSIAGCGITTTSSSSSITTPPVSVSSNSCVGTAVSCSTWGDVDRGIFSSCATSYSSIVGCGTTSSPSSSSVTTPPVSVSSNSCLATDIACSTWGNVDDGIQSTCATSYSSIVGCGSTSFSSSSSSIVTTTSSSGSSSISSSSSSPVSSTPPATISITSSSSPNSVSTLPSVSSLSSSTSSISTSPSNIPSSSGPAVDPISLTGSSSTSLSISAPSRSLPTVPLSSLPSSSSGSLIGVVLPVSTGSSSTSSSLSVSSPSLPSSASSSISPGSVSTPTSGPSASPASISPVLVVITPSGSVSSASTGSNPASLPPAGSVSVNSASGFSTALPSFSGTLVLTTSSPPGIPPPGSPSSSSTVPGSPSLAPGLLKLPSGSASITGTSSLISPTASISPSTLSKVPPGSSISSASVPKIPLTRTSGTLTSSASASASASASGLLQSINASGTSSPTGTGGGGGGNPSPTDDPKTINQSPDIWPVTQTILGDYTPLVVARGFLMLLSALYHQLEMYEPIRQLLTPGGGSLVDSPVMIPIQIAIISAHIGTGFSAGATFFDTSYCNPVQTSTNICPPKLSVNPWVVDVIIVTLVVQVLTIIYVISQWWKKPGGFSADPTSIAGIAAFMGHPEVEQEFIQLPTEISYAGLKRRLRGKKFRLGQFATERGIVKYGIMPADDENETKKKDGFFDKIGNWWSKFQGKFTFLHHWKKNRFLFDALFVMLLLALLGLVIDAVSRVNKTQVVFLATASASGTGWRIFTSILGVVVSYYWGRLFRDAQNFAPYIDLGRGSSNPDATILLKRHSIPLTAFFPLLWYCHYTPASVAFIGIIAELLIVALSGLPYRPGQQRGEFLFWGIASLTILTIMIVQLISISLWRRKLPYLPRAPESIAAVMTYLAGTNMTRDFNGLEKLGRKERDQAIRDLEKNYAYWWRREEGDGRVRWVVDEVPGGKNRALIDSASEFS